MNIARVTNRKTGRIVATVFQTAQTLHQDGYDVTLGCGSNYSAHRF